MMWITDSISTLSVMVDHALTSMQNFYRSTFLTDSIDVICCIHSVLLSYAATYGDFAELDTAIDSEHAITVVNLLQAPPSDNRQVMLQVKFATMDRTTLSQLGANLFSVNNRLVGSLTTQQFQFPRLGQLQLPQGANGQPQLGNEQVTINDLLNL